MRLTLAIVGAHGAGKTTVGRALAAALNAPFQEEIGYLLAQERRPAGQTAEDPQEAFDEAIFRAERARDAAWSDPATGSSIRVVETWHPGNLAYAARRSPAVVERHVGALVRQLCADPSHIRLVLPVTVPPEVRAGRQHEPGDPAFFRAVGEEAVAWARALGLTVLDPVVNDGPIHLSVSGALARLHPHLELR